MKKLLLVAIAFFFSYFLFAQQDPVGLNVNDKAPMFKATDQNGTMFDLSQALKKGKVVLIFYRGQWCPYCNKQLKHLEDSLSMIMNKGALLVAVTPEQPENIQKTIEKTKAAYPVLYDDGLSIMKNYDVAYAVDDATISKYKNYGIDFTIANGVKNGANLPVPTVYIINTDGKIIYRHFDKDYTKRASVAEILGHL
jgi:peroxiredoxin